MDKPYAHFMPNAKEDYVHGNPLESVTRRERSWHSRTPGGREMRFRFTRRDILAFGLTLMVSAATAGAVTVAAVGGDGDAPKTKPPRDAPGVVRLVDLPAGEHLTDATTSKMHGGILVARPGQEKDLKPKLDALPARKFTFEEVRLSATDSGTLGLTLDASKLPGGYAVASASGLRRTDESGVAEVAEAALSLEGPGYPITIQRWVPPSALVGEPFSVPLWTEGYVMTTLGEVRGIPAVFVHRRPGVKSSELQQIFISDGKYMLLVESYLDDFKKLIAAAESVLVGSGRVN